MKLPTRSVVGLRSFLYMISAKRFFVLHAMFRMWIGLPTSRVYVFQ